MKTGTEIMDFTQKTLSQTATFRGKGLHSGRLVTLRVLPAPANTGIVFRRIDTSSSQATLAHVSNVSSTRLSTTLGHGASQVGTIEHLMAALFGVGVDNAFVEVDAPELPIMDGSSFVFVNEFLDIGVRSLAVQKRIYSVKKRFEYREGDKFIRVDPARHLRFRCSIDFASSTIGRQSLDYIYSAENFGEVAQARTFCHLREVEAMRESGLALGGSLNNAIVVSDDGILNAEGLRVDDEFVRHKLLDCIGDLSLLGASLIGQVTVHKPGHGLHVAFMNELLSHLEEYITVVEPVTAINSRESERQKRGDAASNLIPAFG